MLAHASESVDPARRDRDGSRSAPRRSVRGVLGIAMLDDKITLAHPRIPRIHIVWLTDDIWQLCLVSTTDDSNGSLLVLYLIHSLQVERDGETVGVLTWSVSTRAEVSMVVDSPQKFHRFARHRAGSGTSADQRMCYASTAADISRRSHESPPDRQDR